MIPVARRPGKRHYPLLLRSKAFNLVPTYGHRTAVAKEHMVPRGELARPVHGTLEHSRVDHARRTRVLTGEDNNPIAPLETVVLTHRGTVFRGHTTWQRGAVRPLVPIQLYYDVILRERSDGRISLRK